MTTETIQPGLDDLMTELRRRRWTLYRWGPAEDPAYLLGLCHRVGAIDGILLQHDGTGYSYRCPDNTPDAFRPDEVMFQWAGAGTEALRAILGLVHPDSPDAPTGLQAPFPGCVVPADLPRPFVIRPLSSVPPVERCEGCHE